MRSFQRIAGIIVAFASLARAQSTPTPTETTTPTQTYPTTVTSIWSTTLTAIVDATPGASPATADTWITARTVTLLDPWPESPDPYSYPYTVHETSIVRETVTKGAATTSSSSTAYPTWLIWDTQAADLPVGITPRCEKMESGHQCAPSAWKPEARCLALGQETRCHAQCTIREWQWWCRQEARGNSTTLGSREPPMGRLCWGGADNYTQLAVPCDGTDYPPECAKCEEAT